MIKYQDTRQMLMDGHLQLDAVSSEKAIKAFGQWLEERCAYLKEHDPQGLVAFWSELHVD